MKIMLPWIGPVDLSNPPQNLEEKVTESFQRFTSGTNPEYVDDDKLYYVDKIRKALSPHKYPHDAVTEVIMGRQRANFEENGEFLDFDDFNHIVFAEEMYDLGIKHTDLYDKRGESGSDGKQINSTIARIIRVVMNYGV